jgi:hypothetical protein
MIRAGVGVLGPREAHQKALQAEARAGVVAEVDKGRAEEAALAEGEGAGTLAWPPHSRILLASPGTRILGAVEATMRSMTASACAHPASSG